MKLIAILFFLSFTVFSYGQQVKLASTIKPDSLSREFQQIAERWLIAYNSTDATKLTPLYLNDAQYISSHVPGLVAEGRDQVIQYFQKGMSGGGHLDGMEIMSINNSCDVATILCKYYANNSGNKVTGRTILVLKRLDSNWFIVLHMTVV